MDPRQHETGLYEKYEVYKDGETVEDCFVLEPEGDSAAFFALLTYAEQTDNDELARDIRDWLNEIKYGKEP